MNRWIKLLSTLAATAMFAATAAAIALAMAQARAAHESISQRRG